MDFHDIVKMQKVKLKIKSVESNLLFDYWLQLANRFYFKWTEAEFNEFESRLKSGKNRFQLSAGLNLEELICLSL